jgi:aryl-phospho-beta-D-glucosidase BglC (GH1 family)
MEQGEIQGRKLMKMVKKILAVFMLCALTLSLCPVGLMWSGTDKKAEAAAVTLSQQYAQAMNPGWNLGNTFDSYNASGPENWEESWGNPKVTRELIKTIKEQGFHSIRIPLTIATRTGPAPDYTIDQTFLARYAQVVQWALEEGLYVMINIHHDSWTWAEKIGSDDGTALAKYKAIWTQLADYFKDYSDKLCFESINEPKFSDSDEQKNLKTLEQVNTEFYHIVRNSGGNNTTRMLVLPTYYTRGTEAECASLYQTIQKLDDDYIMATIHYYSYYSFSVNLGVTTMTSQVTGELTDVFDRVYNQFIANGIGVICGEYGLLGFDNTKEAIEHGEILKYLEYINYYAKKKDITLMLWDNGQHLNRTSYTWYDPSFYNMLKTSWSGRSSYAESDRIFVNDDTISKNVTLKLTENGNTLKDIYNGNTRLKKGTDYTLSGSVITFKAKYIKSVITGSYGINATLTMKFSAGADWEVYLTRYKLPVVGTGKGSASGFTIPVEFNGSRISTIEALNEKGSGTGPDSWTKYKMYGKAFSVDYTKNNVTILKYFFENAPDGIITFKLHFQSGEILSCKVKKAGTQVTYYVAKPTLKDTSVTIGVGRTWTCRINDLDSSATVTYSSSNKAVAAVSKTGKITAYKKGTAKITATVLQNGKTYKLTMTVKVS